MTAFLFNASPYRKWPASLEARLTSRTRALAPHPGRQGRIAMVARTPRIIHDELPKRLKTGLRGVDEEGQRIMDLARKVLPLAEGYREFAFMKLKSATTIMLTIENAYMASRGATKGDARQMASRAHPLMSGLERVALELYTFGDNAAKQARLYLKEIPERGVMQVHRDFYSRVSSALESLSQQLSEETRKQMGLSGGIEIVILLIVAVIAAIVAVGGVMLTGKLVELFHGPASSDDIAELKASIDNDPYLSEADKTALSREINSNIAVDLESYIRAKRGGIASTIGWVVIGGLTLWLLGKVFLGTGFVGSIGRGIGHRIALSPPASVSTERAGKKPRSRHPKKKRGLVQTL